METKIFLPDRIIIPIKSDHDQNIDEKESLLEVVD
jgi:hypothetical protein